MTNLHFKKLSFSWWFN